MPEDVSLLIEDQEFHPWSSIEIFRAVDSFSTVTYGAPFEPDNAAFRETFRPFKFQPVEVLVGGDRLFRGRQVDIGGDDDPDATTVEVSAYSLPGTLADCTEPASAVPLEFKGVGFRQIAEQLCSPFGVGVELRDGEPPKFDKVKLEVEDKVFEFIAELSRQLNRVLTDTPDGQLLCWKSVEPGHPIARLQGDMPPVTKVTRKFSPQEYFSEITGFAKATRKNKGGQHTAQNPFLRNVLRPMCFKLEDTERGNAPEATQARLGRMFANMASFDVELPTWRDPAGNLWAPNQTVTLLAPRAMCYRESELLIRSVILFQDDEKETTTLNLVLPGAFSGKVPEFLPWDEP